LRDVRNWHHLGDVAISADGRFAPIVQNSQNAVRPNFR
jgi:hypothetical protein